jgi:hypothetical protein
MVLPKESRSGVAPLRRHSAISAGLATSKLEPFRASIATISAAGFALTA